MLRVTRLFTIAFISCFSAIHAIEPADRSQIQNAIQAHTDTWNLHACEGFANDYTEDADFVNIFGMHFSGKAEIENRHIQILKGFLKNSNFEVLNTQLREVNPELVIAIVHWRLDGFRTPGSDISKPGETRNGIFTHVFVKSNDEWKITASQNTLAK